MTDFERRLREDLEPILVLPDPREKLSAYHDMPYALFRYDPEQEYPLGLHRALAIMWALRLKNRPPQLAA